MRKLACALALLAITVTAQGAHAHFVSHPDPQDTPDGFDLERVRLRLDDEDLVGKAVTYGDWPCCWTLAVKFDSRGNDRLDYYALIEWDGASGGIISRQLHRRGGRPVQRIRVRADWQDGELRFRFDESLLNATKHVRWRVVASSWLADEDWQDLAPDSGWFDD